MQPTRNVRIIASGRALALVAALALLAVACGGDDKADTTSTEPPLVALDGIVNNHGTKDLGTAAKVEVELDDLYFSPTFVKAKPGTEIEISLKNDGEVKHTFTIDDTKTNVELDAGQKASVKVTLPASGALAYYCSFHRGSGMQGAFSVSTTTAAAGSGTPTTVASSSGGYGY
ncbi:MAG: cupredoxin domain-containing protein [Acidimicrobiales bacterium]